MRDDDFLVGSGRMWSDYRRIWSDVVGLSSNRSWQAHYLVRLQGAFACSAQWK